MYICNQNWVVTAGILGITECVNPIQVSYEAHQWFLQSDPDFYKFVWEIILSSVVPLSMLRTDMTLIMLSVLIH